MSNAVNFRRIDEENKNKNGYLGEYDFKIPKTGQRIRKRIRIKEDILALYLLQVLEHVIKENMTLAQAMVYINEDDKLKKYSESLEKKLKEWYFDYIDSDGDIYSEDHNRILEDKFPLSEYNGKFAFYGRAGVGKSTVINKITPFWKWDKVNFPFIGSSSRTSTYPADYCFVNKDTDFKFMVTFLPDMQIDMYITDCITRAVTKLLEIETSDKSDEKKQDEVINAFCSDPTQVFDIKFSLGRYKKSTSKGFNDSEYQKKMVPVWSDIYEKICNILHKIKENIDIISNSDDVREQICKEKYDEAIKKADEENPIYQCVYDLLQKIREQMRDEQEHIIETLEKQENIFECKNTLFEDERVKYFSCKIKTLESQEFYDFIKIFTEKSYMNYGNSLFNIVDHLRIELPVNKNIQLEQKDFSFVIQDTMGVAHDNSEGGNLLIDSVNLSLENVDAVVIFEDSKISGDNNASALLSHVASRMHVNKIYFAFTFFDDLDKEIFDAEEDEEDEKDEQKKKYLIDIEKNMIEGCVDNKESALLLCKNIETEKNCCFMKHLMNERDFSSIKELLSKLILFKNSMNEKKVICKINARTPFIVYDYRKISALYLKAYTQYMTYEKNIYEIHYPPYKTTEALTKRLSRQIPSFVGARTLCPLDDLYQSILNAFEEYINEPEEKNYIIQNSNKEVIMDPLNVLKETVFEEIRKSILKRFFSERGIEQWRMLYMLSGIGSDKKRRAGIISTEEEIVPNINLYYNVPNYWINEIERILKNTINEIENEYFDIKK